MNITGVIAEYNPFHKGHEYHLKKIREAGADYIIVVMSGDFTQRGEPAIIDKYCRTRMALEGGADMVIELPLIYSLADARRFAEGGVGILDALGCVNVLSFGVEPGTEGLIFEFAEFLNSPPTAFDTELDRQMRNGLTYPAARQQALSLFFTEDKMQAVSSPNAILGIEYCKALKKTHNHMVPQPVIRSGNGYNDISLPEEGFASASAIREVLRESSSLESLSPFLPDTTVSILSEELGDSFPVWPEDLSSLLRYALLSQEDFTRFTDINEAFSNRLLSLRYKYSDLEQFIDEVKTRNITRTGVCRLLMQIVTGLDLAVPRRPAYARILGFRKNSNELFTIISKTSILHLVQSLAEEKDDPYILSDIKASHIYEGILSDKFGTPFKNEYSRMIIKE
ncbi:MAG: nucleotidyltransferase family protein [Lachnospiraceae bacterium]|nr:nucleotidyltransferase family protein [Lachnospiraceae bacterium]